MELEGAGPAIWKNMLNKKYLNIYGQILWFEFEVCARQGSIFEEKSNYNRTARFEFEFCLRQGLALAKTDEMIISKIKYQSIVR